MRKEKTSGIKILKNTPHEKFKKIGGCFFASMLNLIPLISIFFISNQIEFYFTKLTINSTEHQDFFYTIKTKQISKSKQE